MNKPLLRLIQRKNVAYTNWRKMATPAWRSTYNLLHKHVRHAVKEAKKSWAIDCFTTVQMPADFWKAVRQVSTSRYDLPASLLLPDGMVAVSGQEKVSALAATFSQNFNNSDCLPVALPDDSPVEPQWLCNDDFIFTELSALRPTVATGWDGLPARFLRAIAASIVQPLVTLINRCISEGVCPTHWKLARVTPIPKTAHATEPTDFRPISVLPGLSKIFERWLLHCIKPYLLTNCCQFAYSAGSATEDAVALLQHLVSAGFQQCVSLSRPTRVALVALDIKRAYDQVPHHALLTSCQHRGLPSCLLRVLKSCLLNRQQFVRIGQASSETHPVKSGVPQGSVVGGLLFNVYVDKIFHLQLSPNARMLMYADDLLLVKPLLSADSELELNSDIAILDHGFKDLFLSLNSSKCKVLMCSLSPNPPTFAQWPVLNNARLEVVDSLKYLGVHLDRKLSFDANTKSAVCRAKRALGVLHCTVGKAAGSQIFRKLYVTKIMPMFLYLIPVTAPRFKKDWLLLEKLHRFACRLITNDFQKSYTVLLKECRFYSVSRTYFIRGLRLLWKYMYESRRLPGVLQLALPSRRITRRKCHEFTLVQPAGECTSRIGQMTPLYKLIKYWNELAAVPDFTTPVLSDLKLLTKFLKQPQTYDYILNAFSIYFPDISVL